MKNKIPYSLFPFRRLKRMSNFLLGIGDKLKKSVPDLENNLKQTGMTLTAQEYIAMSLTASLIFLIFINVILNIALLFFQIERPFMIAFVISLPLTAFIFIQQTLYPKLILNRKIRDIDRNILPALNNMLVQLNSGIPLFQIMMSISEQNYGEVSKEFTKAVKKINVGLGQIEVLEEMANDNPSQYFRRAIWQLVSGMKMGADIGITVKETIVALSEEQLIQIQKYGSQLNPLAMFYMLTTVILPSLGITFLVLISSLISTSELGTKTIFWGLYGLVIFFQIMFLGIIKTRRPTLLED